MIKSISNRIKKNILKRDVISFDIFDTLICRNCLTSTDIFSYVEKKYNEISKNKIIDFTTKRIEASRLAKAKYKVEEATFDEIYECFDNKYDKVLLKKLELQAEEIFCVANEEMKCIYDFAIENKKRIICVSDMYYDAKTLKRLLSNCGYFIDEIYVSSEYRVKKSTGKLFKKLVSLNKFNPKDVFHIGDAEKGDFLYPKLIGIKTLLIKPTNKNKFLNKNNIDLNSLNNNLIYSICNNKNNSNYYYRFGYEVLGPVCLYFSLWINSQLYDRNSKLLFCARDMKMLHEIHNILFPKTIDVSEYFYVSRRSLRLPYLYKNNTYACFKDSITNNRLNICELVDNLNLLDEEVIKHIKNIRSFDIEKKYNKDFYVENKEFIELYENCLKEKISFLGKKEYNNLNNYFDSLNVKSFYLIDMGWKGTTQSILYDLYPQKLVGGLYFGIDSSSKYKEINNNTSIGYLFYKNKDYIDDIQFRVYSFRDLFEKMFSSHHGTTIKYNDKDPYYVLGKPNANDSTIELIQRSAVDFIRDISKYIDYISRDNSYEYINIFTNCFINPSCKFVTIFGNIINDNMFNRKMASPKSILYYIFHLKSLKKDFGESGWKIGFMKRLLKIKLPYFSIYKKAYSHKIGK